MSKPNTYSWHYPQDLDRIGDQAGMSSPSWAKRAAHWTRMWLRHPIAMVFFPVVVVPLTKDTAVSALHVYGNYEMRAYSGVELPGISIEGDAAGLRRLAAVLLDRADRTAAVQVLLDAGTWPSQADRAGFPPELGVDGAGVLGATQIGALMTTVSPEPPALLHDQTSSTRKGSDMPENTNPIVDRTQHLAVRNLLADYDQGDAAEQLPAGTYRWSVQLTWPARPVDLRSWGRTGPKLGDPLITTFPGELTLDGPVSRAVVLDQLWRGLRSAAATEPIPADATVTAFNLRSGGGQ
ncbi:hypothetical protein ABIA35_000565 [Catenulispora sp. MAP12-49]|uniref:hypothetical protein n=1 Tax=Catenulispora sp. MAP12-49 TaxID=3156302 RepID=UPI003516AC01